MILWCAHKTTPIILITSQTRLQNSILKTMDINIIDSCPTLISVMYPWQLSRFLILLI